MPVRKKDIPDDVMAALADPKEQAIPDDVLAALGESKKKVSGNVSETGTTVISPSTSPVPLTSEEVAKGVFSFGQFRNKKEPLPANIPRTKKKIESALKNVHFGAISQSQLTDLYNDANGREVAKGIIKQYSPDATDENIDNPATIETAAKNIKQQNRINFVNAEKDGIIEMDDVFISSVADFNKGIPNNSAGTMTGYINELRRDISIDDLNNNDKISDVIARIKKVSDLEQGYLSGEEKKAAIEKTQELLNTLNNRLLYNISRTGVSPTLNQLDDQIQQAVISKVMESERGENGEASDKDQIKLNQFKLGLTAIEKSDPVLFKNVVNSISSLKKVADTDFSVISKIGQQIDNQVRFRGAAYDPNLIDTETEFEYDTFGQNKSAAAGAIGEWMKEKGYKNMNQFPEKLIRQAAKETGVDNPEIVNSLVFDEKLGGYDAIPKSGWLDDVTRGIMQPLEGINSTLNSWNESPAQTYLRSKDLSGTFGSQKVPDKKGGYSDILESEHSFTTDMFRGLGQFIPQILLTKGVGGAVRAGAGLTGAELSASQAKNVADYGGTFISTFLQSYGPAYEEHLQKTGDANTSALIGTIDGISSGAFELILPDVKIAGKAFDGLKQGLSNDLIDLVRKGGDPSELLTKAQPLVAKFFKSATNTLAQENLEELGTQYTDFVTESIFDPKSAKDRNINKELWDTFKSTTASMLLPSIMGAAGGSFTKDFTTKSLHSAAINLDSYKESLQNSLDKEYISQDDYNKSLKILQTHQQSIGNAPEINANGQTLAPEKKLDYALEDTKIKVYKEKAAATEGVAKEMWEGKIKQAEDVQREILMPKEAPVEEAIVAEEEVVAPESNAEVVAEKMKTPVNADEQLFDKVYEKGLGINNILVPENKTESVSILKDQALSTPSNINDKLDGDEELTTDLIASNGVEKINTQIQSLTDQQKDPATTDQETEEIDKHLSLLDRGLEKATILESKNNTNLSQETEAQTQGAEETGVLNQEGAAETIGTETAPIRDVNKTRSEEEYNEIAKAFEGRFGIKINVVDVKEADKLLNSEGAKNFFFKILDDVDVFDSKDPSEAKKFIDQVFNTVANAEDAKTAYRRLAVKYHPDKQGSDEIMGHVNSVYEKYKKRELGQSKGNENKYSKWANEMYDKYKEPPPEVIPQKSKVKKQVKTEEEIRNSEASLYQKKENQEKEAKRSMDESISSLDKLRDRTIKSATDDQKYQIEENYWEHRSAIEERHYNLMDKIENEYLDSLDALREGGGYYFQKSGSNVSGIYDFIAKEAYIISQNADETTPIHEAFSHPLIDAVEVSNKELYKNLVKEAKNTPEIVDYVDENYRNAPQKTKDKEYIARAIDLESNNELRNKKLIQYIREFWAEVSNTIKDIFGGKEAKIENIDANTTVKELVDFVLKSGHKIDLKKAVSAEQVEAAQPTKNEDQGVGRVFNQNVELTRIGTIKEYSEYIDSVFPNSKIKNILYRTALEEYMTDTESGLIFMSPDIDYGKILNKSGKKITVTMIVDVRSPKVLSGSKFLLSQDKGAELEGGKYDAVVADVTSLRKDPPKNSDIYEVAVPSASQIHILGSRADAEQFKEWKNEVIAKKGEQVEKAQPKTEAKVDRKGLSDQLRKLLGNEALALSINNGDRKVSDLKKELKKLGVSEKIINAIPDGTRLREGILADTSSVKDTLYSLLGVAGVFKRSENLIRIGKLYSFWDRGYVLLHEAVHAATSLTFVDILNNPKNYTQDQVDAAKEIRYISEQYTKSTPKALKLFSETLYGTKDPYEFMAEFVSSKKFRDYVGKNSTGYKTNIVSYIWEKVLSMLGISKKEINNNFVGYIDRQIDHILEASAKRNIENRGALPLNSKNDINPNNRLSFRDIGLKNGDTIQQAIDKAIAHGEELSDFLKIIKTDPNLKNVTLELVDRLPNGEMGLYHPVGHGEGKDGLLQIADIANVKYSIVHELGHFFTLDSKAAEDVKGTAGYNGIEEFYNYIAARKGKPVAGSASLANYGLTNVKEFMAEMFINPTFRNYVSDVFETNKGDILKTNKFLRDSKVSSIGDMLANFFRDLFNKLVGKGQEGVQIDASKSVIDNAVKLATDLFLGGQDITSGQTASTGAVVPLNSRTDSKAAALGLPGADQNKIINDFVKSSLENGATVADIKGALVDNGFTEDEAQAFIDTNKLKGRVTAEDQTKGFENKPKSILNRISESKNIPDNIKEKFADQLTYNPQSHSVARDMARAITKEFGLENSIAMAEAGRFNGDVNSLIFAEAIDQTFEREQAATTPEGKQKLAEQWADYSIRYDEAARQKGRFISAVYDFYKKSPLGIIIAERSNREQVFKKWFKNKEAAFKEVFKELSGDPEFKQFVQEKVDVQLKSERAVTRMKRRKKITDIFDNAKFKGDTLHSSLVPPQLWNAAVEVMKQAYLAGDAIADVIAQGINHIKDNHSESWDVDQFRKEWEEKLKGVDGDSDAKVPSKDNQQKILDRFRRKLSGLSDSQKEDVIRRSFKTLVENGALEYAEFKKIVADVMNLGELSPEEVQKITEYVKDVNAVQDAADNAQKERTPKALEDFQKIAKKAERSATELGNIVNSKTDLLQRVRSIIQLNTLGVVSLIKNPIYNLFHQSLVRLPKGIIMTGVDQAIYGLSLLSNKITGSAILKPQTNIFLAQKGYFKQGAKGGSESINQVFTGLTSLDYFQKEIRTSQIKPAQAWRDIWQWKKGEKFLDNAQIADRLIQGTVGIPAEAVARMLNIGDKPFRFAAQAAMSETIATQQFGLKGIDKEIFTTFPKEEATRLYKEKGMDHDAAVKKAEALEKRIVDEGEQAVFQQKNLVMEGLNGLGAMMKNFSEDKPIAKGGVAIAKIVGTLNTPFLKTPLNIFWELFNLVTPEVALTQSAIYGFMAGRAKFKGDSEKASEYAFQAKKWMAHGATGYSLLATFGYFASIGAISGGGDDDSAKERKGKKTYQKSHALNLAKVMRAFTGGNTRDEDDDLMVDLSWFGAPGMIMNIQADRYENMTQEERDKMSYIAELQNRMHGAAADGLENSIFQGTIAGINAFKQGGRWVNTWVMNQVNVGSNFFQPATFAQFSRGTLPYNPAIKADNFAQELKNNFAARSILFRAFAGYPPSDITIWGDKAMRNNTGAKGVAFNMLGFDEYNKDTFAEPIFQDYKRTGNSSFFPTDVRPTMTVDGQDKKMTVEQERQFKTLVGQARKSLVAPFVNDMATFKSKDREINGKTYNELSDEQKVKALNVVYKKGYEAGKAQFKELYSDFQAEKEREEE